MFNYKHIKYLFILAVIVGLSWCCWYIWSTRLAPYFVGQGKTAPSVEPKLPDSAPALPPPIADVPGNGPAISGDLQMLLAQAKQEFQEEKLLASRKTAYSGLEKCEEYSPSWLEFAQVIDNVNKVFMSGSAPAPEKKPEPEKPAPKPAEDKKSKKKEKEKAKKQEHGVKSFI